jgi:nitrite reductase/ring-hydroxylating ferredoxin subunit
VTSRKVVVGPVASLPPGSRRVVEVGGRGVVVFHEDGRYYAIRDVCPHLGGPLSAGPVVGSLEAPAPGCYRYDGGRHLVKCPWHGWEFDLATGQSWIEASRERVRAYPVSIESGSDLVEAADAPPGRVPGPYVVDTVRVSVEEDYIVLEL